MSMGEKSRERHAGSQGATGAEAPGANLEGAADEARGEDQGHAADEATEAPATPGARDARGLDVARDSDVPISTQLYWQLAYQVDTGRLHAGARLPTVRELGAVLRVNPNTVRAVYRRLADAGYVVSRHGAGTRVAARPPVRRTTGTLDGLVAELLRSAARAAETISTSFAGLAEADGALIDNVVDRLERHHYDLVATSTFHAAETIALVAGRAPVVALMAAPSYAELLDEIGALPPGSTVGMVCSSARSTANMEDWLARSGGGTRLIEAVAGDEEALARVDRDADLLLLTREALEIGLAPRFHARERIREWTYDLDPAGLELLRLAIERVRAARPDEG
jgi:DNA-binding transcriptional regulator YhcF (GntR family)